MIRYCQIVLDLKLKFSSYSMSWRIFYTKNVPKTLINPIKPLEEFEIEDTGFGPISVKNLLNLFLICLWSKDSISSIIIRFGILLSVDLTSPITSFIVLHISLTPNVQMEYCKGVTILSKNSDFATSNSK